MHRGQDIGPGLLRKILRDIEIDAEELGRFLSSGAAPPPFR
jgi:hypothetical protein